MFYILFLFSESRQAKKNNPSVTKGTDYFIPRCIAPVTREAAGKAETSPFQRIRQRPKTGQRPLRCWSGVQKISQPIILEPLEKVVKVFSQKLIFIKAGAFREGAKSEFLSKIFL